MEIIECFDTDYIQIPGSPKRYCPYCGKEIKPIDNYEDHEEVTYYKCDCEEALKAYDIRLQIRRLEYQLPVPKYRIEPMVVKRKELD